MTIIELLAIPHILIGSRALGVNTEMSDYDIVVLRKYLPKSLNNRLTNGTQIKQYFNLTPCYGEGWILRGENYASGNKLFDIIVLESEKDIAVVKKSIKDIIKANLPYYFLSEKHIRVKLFETALRHYGWTSAN